MEPHAQRRLLLAVVVYKMSWKHVYAWHLSEVEVYETPLPYKNEHSVIWLDVRKAVADFAAA